MGILDFIRNLFGSNKKQARIITNGLSKIYGESAPLEVALFEDKTPVCDKKVIININGVEYTRKTDNDGVARLNINLRPGVYDSHIVFDDVDYEYVKTFTKVVINPVIDSSDLSMVEGDGSRYGVRLCDVNGVNVSGVKVVFTVNGVNYERTTNDHGVARLKINLQAGDYDILTTSYEVVKKNTIHIEEAQHKDEGNHFGYWVFGKDMTKVNLNDLKNRGVTDIFLNYYAFNTHGESTVQEWIQNAYNNNINVHIWMQSFYDGEWHNPKNTDLNSKINEAQKYANIHGVYGVHLDYLRYPGNAYKTQGGTEAINEFVKNVRAAIGDKFLSCAVMPETETKYYYGQDIEVLGRICDAVLPMQYKGNYNAGTSWLASTTKIFSQIANIWSGLQAYRSDEDTTILSESELNEDISTCIGNGAKGVILFRYGLSQDIYFKK